MRVSREQVARNRERIIEIAARLFRERGLAGVGVAEVMKEAGLTHGGFYGYFASKDDLIAEATRQALSSSAARFEQIAREQGVAGLAETYLSEAHREGPGSGCPYVTLGSEAARAGDETRRVFTEGLRSHVEILTRSYPDMPEADARQQALASMASMVGSMVLARFIDDPDFAAEMLRATASHLIANTARQTAGV